MKVKHKRTIDVTRTIASLGQWVTKVITWDHMVSITWRISTWSEVKRKKWGSFCNKKKFARFSAADLAKILNVKMLLPHPDTMDTWADRNHLANQNCWTQGRASATAPKDVEQQCTEGHCFTCNKQGHISQNCLDKPVDSKTDKPPFQKKKAKACQVAIVDKESSDDGTDYGSPEANTWVHKGQTLPREEKEDIICHAWEAETGDEQQQAIVGIQ